ATVTWINIDKVADTKVTDSIGKRYNIHPLILEDISNTDQRPKIDVLENYIYVVAKMLYSDTDKDKTVIEQVSFILGQDYVVSFQERPGDVFDHIREMIRHNKGLIRKMGADYLLCSLIDSIVDNYFNICDRLEEKIECLDDELLGQPSQETINEINSLKREMIFIRKAIWPLREVVNILERTGPPLVLQKTIIHLRDVYDHVIQIIDLVETLQEILSSMVDTYLSSISNRTNEVMKILTIIATIFIPLTFIAGVYGMNFRFMPELELIWGYPLIVGVMFTVSIVMLLYFRRKKWI
ncbi:MAG: magnesium/cobalt transporter CorA, partial [Candidatus Odinarchaeota archaeon]